jgi:intracellular multiplication protein IcmO
MSTDPIRDLDPSQELSPHALMRDVRPPLVRAIDSLRSVHTMVVTLIGHAVVVFMFPAFGIFALITAVALGVWGLRQKESAPIKLPIQSGMLDPHELHPGNKRPIQAGGIFLLGTTMAAGAANRDTGKQVWLTNDDCRQHFLVVGTTGAGKTEMLLGFCANALSWGSGFLFCDGKGDVSTFAKIYALARRFGREDDILVVNLMTSNADVGVAGGKILSNTLNPFTSGSSDSLTQMVVSLMDDAGGDGAMWKGRAVALFTGVMRALVWKRDAGLADLNIGLIRDCLNLNKIIELADREKEPHMPAPIRTSIDAYLASLPGFQKDKGTKQAQTTLDQHGYLQMQFTRILGSLADVYGHIFLTPHGEVDMNDVVLGRRILVVMLPALEKSSDEVANLGKIIVAMLKGMMGGTLGSVIENTWDTVVDARPYASKSPFITILDEVGYYTVSGLAVMSAQARSLGFSLVFATQDIPAMLRNDDKEAKSMIANTTTKVFMRVEETEMTAKLAVDSAGTGQFATVSGFAAKAGEFSKPYLDNMEARFEKQERITVRNLRALGVGEAYVTWRDSVFKIRTFHAHPEGEYGKSLKQLELRANHFLAFSKPTKEEVKKTGVLVDIAERLDDPRFAQIVESRAKDERAAIARLAAEKKDPTSLRNEISAGAVAFLRAAYGDGKKATSTDLVSAGAASIAAICQAMQKQGDKFARDVRAVEGLSNDGQVRSGRARAASQVPGLVDPTSLPPLPPGRPAQGASPFAETARRGDLSRPGLPPSLEALRARAPVVPQDAFTDEFDEAPPPPDDDDERNETASLASALEQLGSPEARREAAFSPAPSRMREVEHGVSVDNVAYDMARKMQNNETALHFLAALDFEGEPGQDAVDAALDEAATGSAEALAPPPAAVAPVTAAELERADVASARAAQWVERAEAGKPRAAPVGPEEFEMQMQKGDAQGMTHAFLADLLAGDE